MGDPTRIRAQEKDGKVVVRALMRHAMESGFRQDDAGQIVPAWWIQDVTASQNGKQVFSAQWGRAISKNPFLEFTIKEGKKGDTISISWKDSKGDTRTDEATVS